MTKITVTADQKTLDKTELYQLGNFDNGGRWWPINEIEEYFTGRTPSRAWPLSYWKAAKTQKFLKWLKANKPELVEVV